MMKKTFSVLTLLAIAPFTEAAGSIHEKIHNEKRFVVFNSRRLSGECCK
jgi:hypothetical protein